MWRTRTSKHCSASFLTVELLLSLGLASAAFGSFLVFYNSVRQQQVELRRYAAATFLLQSTVEEVRAGRYGSTLESLHWEADSDGWRTAGQTAGLFEWNLTSETRPQHGQLFPFKTAVSWRERGRQQRVVAATQLLLK